MFFHQTNKQDSTINECLSIDKLIKVLFEKFTAEKIYLEILYTYSGLCHYEGQIAYWTCYIRRYAGVIFIQKIFFILYLKFASTSM